MTSMFYVAFIVDHDIRHRSAVVVEAGVDLLAGPYPTHEDAVSALRIACARHPRLTAFAALAAFISRSLDNAPVRIDVIPINETQVVRYNAIHPEVALSWPPPVLTSSQTLAFQKQITRQKVSVSHAKP